MPNRKPPATAAAEPFHAMDAAVVLRRLETDQHAGLSINEAAARLRRYGPNEITAAKAPPAILRFLHQFHAPLVYILLIAAAVTLALREYLDSAVILGVVLVNALIGFIQETRALAAIDALARTMKIEATIRRDGRRRRIPAPQLVPGDMVLLEPGDKVPADVRLVQVRDLHADESTLTGESAPVSKRADPLEQSTLLADRRNMAYAGTLITRGHGEGVVVATGGSTEVGQISRLISSAEQLATPLTRKITAFSRLLLWAILGLAALTFIVGLWRGIPATDVFMAAVALAVGAIPEGLPAAVTIMLAIGVSRMASRRAIIRKLPAVEALGSTTVICSDKTGTLTQNQMTVQGLWAGGEFFQATGGGYDPAGEIHRDAQPIHAADHPALWEMLRCGALCNDSSLAVRDHVWEIHGDPTEAALLVAARKGGGQALDQDELAERHRRIDVIPFESERQSMATLHDDPQAGQRIICVKGSVERVLAMCDRAMRADGSAGPLDADAVHAAVHELSGQGLRILALATATAPATAEDLTHPMIEHGLIFLGVQGMLDPPRPEAIDAVAKCRHAGIAVKMITGDHAVTASTIAGIIGIGAPEAGSDRRPPALTGADLALVPDEQLPDVAENTAVFARMTPEQKLRLVKALQQRDHIVAMTGDGVNDAPALRQADIGVAMGAAGTEAAKDAADMILADDNFASIEAAVEEGRTVFDNLTKFIIWTLPTNGGQSMVILASIAIGGTLPILPVQALYINLSTGILLGVPIVFEAREPNVMQRPPRDPRQPLFTFELFMRTGLVIILLGAGSMGMFQWELARGVSEEEARSAAVSVIVIGELFYLFSARALLRPFWAIPPLSNAWLWVGIAAMLLVQAAFINAPLMNRIFQTAPLDGAAWLRVFLLGLAVLIIVELEKGIRRWAAGTSQ